MENSLTHDGIIFDLRTFEARDGKNKKYTYVVRRKNGLESSLKACRRRSSGKTLWHVRNGAKTLFSGNLNNALEFIVADLRAEVEKA